MVSFGLAAAILVGGASLVLAEQMQLESTAKMMPVSSTVKPMVLEVGPRGNVLLRGTIETVSTNSIAVKSWGGSWVINILTDTQLMPGSDMTQFQVGNFVGVQGSINTTAAWTVDAKLVRDWTQRKEAKTDKKEIKDVMRASMAKNWQGTASNVNSTTNSFTLTIDGVAYSVTLAADAKVVNKQYAALNLADIKEGDTVRIYATVSGNVATAQVVRDVSTGAKPAN